MTQSYHRPIDEYLAARENARWAAQHIGEPGASRPKRLPKKRIGNASCRFDGYQILPRLDELDLDLLNDRSWL